MEKVLCRNINDQVWVMYKNKPTLGYIQEIKYSKCLDCVDYETIIENEIYDVSFGGEKMGYSYISSEIYDSKEDLIKSL